MAAFSPISAQRLATCDERLQRLFTEVVKYWDCTVMQGHRGMEEQNEAVELGNSKLRWPNGPHNGRPSKAADVYPWPIPDDGTAKGRATYYAFAGYVLGTAQQMGIPIRWGGDWDGDRDLMDQDFDDLVHFEVR